jgi:hypothetical protein
MDKQLKKARREQVKRAVTIYERLTAFYAKYCPDNTAHLESAKKYHETMNEYFTKSLEYYRKNDARTARDYAGHLVSYATHTRDNLQTYFKTRSIDKLLLEKHIRKFTQVCTNPYVDLYDQSCRPYKRDDLCFEIGPYPLEFRGGQVVVGPFRIHIDLRECFRYVRGGDHFQGFRAYPANQWVYQHQGMIHPHDVRWGDGKICSGEAGGYISDAVKQGRLMEAVKYAEALMSSYHKGDKTYTPILVFAQKQWKKKPAGEDMWTCNACGESFGEDDAHYTCNACDCELCGDCKFYCECCDVYYCENHICPMYECNNCGREEADCDDERGGECNECHNYACNDCVYWCDNCGNNYCCDHAMCCDRCSETVCVNCQEYDDVDEATYCGHCHGERVAEREAAERTAEEARQAEEAGEVVAEGGDA